MDKCYYWTANLYSGPIPCGECSRCLHMIESHERNKRFNAGTDAGLKPNR
jgi:hypothetical protein